MAAASFSSSSLLLILALSSLFMSCSAQSSVCRSQIFINRNFSRCVDLPHLNSTFHWTFDSQSSNLILAFKATPARPEGWIAWGINPTILKMPGTQALVAYRGVGTAVVANTYNVSSYSSPMMGNILYNVSNLKAEVGGDGMMTIFATVKLPTNTSRINQVWQVGPAVTGSTLAVHAGDMENLMATGVLDLEGVPVMPPTVAPSPVAGGGGNSGNKISNKNGSVVLSLFFLLLCSSIWG